jgi:hypothetical protein
VSLRSSLALDAAVDLTRTGDVWLFRGHSAADHAIRAVTNSPVNHVGMAVVLEDLPPLMWHAELGRGLVDVWSGTCHRGVQLHDLRAAVEQWSHRYGQRAWLRQLDAGVTAEMEEALLRTIARLDGTPFPATVALAGRWARGRVRRPLRLARLTPLTRLTRGAWTARSAEARRTRSSPAPSGSTPAQSTPPEPTRLETAYCAEVVAATYQAMGLLGDERPTSFYDPGSFWSGDHLALLRGARLGDELEVEVEPLRPGPAPRRAGR